MKKKLRKVLTINQRRIFLWRASKLVAKQLKRKELRDLCSKYNIKFNLRETKLSLATKVCNRWLMEGDIQSLKDVILAAKAHWEERIEVNDRHRPQYYRNMLELSEDVLEIIRKVEEA